MVWQNKDLRQVLLAVWLLEDENRRDRLVQEGRDINNAFYAGYAANSPKHLSDVARRYDVKLSLPAFPRIAEDVVPPALNEVRKRLAKVGRRP